MRIINFISFCLFLVVVGCSNNNGKLIEALKNDADYATIQELLQKGADPNAEDSNGKSSIYYAQEMVKRSEMRLEDVKSGKTKVANGSTDMIIQQMESEVQHNRMILDLLDSH